MEDSSRMLRRAGNLLTSNGQPVKELDLDAAIPLPGSPPLPPQRHKLGLRASIKRRLREVVGGSNGRSQSAGGLGRTPLATPSTTDTEDGFAGRSHARSLSDVPIVPTPIFDSPKTEPIPIEQAPFSAKRHSAGAQLSSVPEVSILSGHEEVMSPKAEQPPASSSAPQLKDVLVPQLLQQGTPMTKVSAKKHKKFVFRLDADLGQIVWESISKQQKIIPIENIKEIRTGSDARYYRQQFQLAQEYEDRWLTIVYILDGTYKTLHLIVATKDVFQVWNKTLRELHAIRQELMRGIGNIEVREALWEKQHWKGAGEERDQRLTFEEIVRLCRRLNINSNQEDLFRLFTRADTQQRGFLDFDDFRRFVKLLKGRPEIDRLYKKLKVDSGGIFDFGVFEKFMRDTQKSTLGLDELQAVFDKYTKNSELATIMSVDSFTAFLLSPDNCAFSDQHSKVFHDMTRPLTEYFISSSHNTYLVGHQLIGDSTIEGYIRALLHSCRSVELDIYDGDHEPMIFHGKSFTSKVSLREVCQVIKKYGFVASPYPIILSAEIHCSVAQQDMIAAIMIEVFEESLVQEPLEELAEGQKIEVLPSPEQLKGKILLKTKNLFLQAPDPVVGGDVFLATDVSASSASDSEAWFEVSQDVPTAFEGRKPRSESDTVRDQLLKARTTVLKGVRNVGKARSSSASSSTSPQRAHSPSPHRSTFAVSPTSTETTLRSPTAMSPRRFSDRRPSDTATELPRPKPKMSPALMALLVYTVGVKFRGINKKEEYAPVHMFSLSENAANKMLKFGMMDLVKHTRTHMVRIYPKGTRLSSTNYEPHRFWCAGAQLVAMNWQTFDLGYMINHAMFQRNGRSGFVLKPLALRVGSKDLLSKRTQHRFDVTIISAQQLPRPKNSSGHEIVDKSAIDPYVQVTIHVPDWPWVPNPGSARKPTPRELSPPFTGAGAAGLASPPRRLISCRTNAVKNNGFNPVWEEKLRIPFECVGDMMDLVFVRFVVRRQEDKDQEEPLAVYCAPLGSLEHGYRHLPLHDSQLSQYLFSTLFVKINITMTPGD